MYNLAEFKPSLITDIHEHTLQFLKFFKGNITITTIGQPNENLDQISVSYFNPTEYDFNTIKLSNSNGHDVYFTVNETNKYGRKAENIESIRAVWADVDIPTTKPRTDWPIPPSLVINTSSVIGENGDRQNKYHYYWLTSTENVDEWERVMEGLVTQYGADVAVKDLARILRLPGFDNHKKDQPYTAIVVGGNGKKYSWIDVKKNFPPVTEAQRKEINPSKSGEHFNLQNAMNEFKSGINISKPLNSLIAHWAHHYSEKNIKHMVDELLDDVPDEIRLQHKQRYYAAFVQVSKWTKSAKATVSKIRAKENLDNVLKIPMRAKPLNAENLVDFTPIPKDSVPECVYLAASEMGRFLANGTEPSIISAMSITCALLGKNVKIHEMGEDTTTFCSSGIVVAMETGTRKTQIYKHMSKPFLEYERILQDEWEDNKSTIQASHILYDKKQKHVEKEITESVQKDLTANEERALIAKMAAIKDQIENLQMDRPSLHIKDITEEEVIAKMHQNSGAISVVSDDSRNIIKNILGRYGNDNTAEGWVIDGMGGTDIKYNRAKNQGTEYTIKDPCLNLYLMVQPDMAVKFKDHEVYRHSGLAARVPVYFYPIDPLEMIKNSDRTRRINSDMMHPYYTSLKELCVRRIDRPMVVELSEAAEQQFNAFNAKFLELLKTTWKGEYKKTNKIITQAVIMATVTAALDDSEFRVKLQSKPELDLRYTLTAQHAIMGCMYVEALYNGMIKSTESLDNLDIAEAAIKFSTSLLKAYESGKIYEGFINTSHLQNTFKMMNKDNRHAIVDMLRDNGWLRVTKAEEFTSLNQGYPGGKVCPGDPIYHLNVKEVTSMLRIKQLESEAQEELKEYKPVDKS